MYPAGWRTGSSAARGLGADHRAIRTQLLREYPVCQCTGWCDKHLGPCTYPSFIADHILNRARGGTTTRDNYQALCRRCSNVKTARESNL